jgi:hypothetical protein
MNETMRDLVSSEIPHQASPSVRALIGHSPLQWLAGCLFHRNYSNTPVTEHTYNYPNQQINKKQTNWLTNKPKYEVIK